MSKLENYLAQQPQDETNGDSRLRREVAYERIKDALQHAGLNPGEPLSELQLSRMLGISRTPIREALQQLAQEGLVQYVPGRMVTVASRTVKDMVDVIHMRSLLEPELARLVAEAANQEHIEILQDSIRRMEEALDHDDYSSWSKADMVFHDTMSRACPNPLLGETVVLMRNRVHHIANTDSKHNPARLKACTAEHRRVVEAIANHAPKEAEAAMREHLAILRESMLYKLTYGG
jgi:GntR family transcriptional regulator of vanillate catabolism